MTIYFETARLMAGSPDGKAAQQKEPLFFSARGWDDFSTSLAQACPEVAEMVHRLRVPVDEQPRHPTYLVGGNPMSLAWTSEECRRLFVALSGPGADATEHDFWSFAALVAGGVAEGGVCTY